MKQISPTSMPAPFGAYSHGVLDQGLLVTSGQLGLSLDGTIPQGIEAQAEICFKYISSILGEAGADFSNVLRFTAFVTRREDMAGYMAVRDRMVAKLPIKPASTLLIVSGFTRPEFLVEVEAIALLAPHSS